MLVVLQIREFGCCCSTLWACPPNPGMALAYFGFPSSLILLANGLENSVCGELFLWALCSLKLYSLTLYLRALHSSLLHHRLSIHSHCFHPRYRTNKTNRTHRTCIYPPFLPVWILHDSSMSKTIIVSTQTQHSIMRYSLRDPLGVTRQLSEQRLEVLVNFSKKFLAALFVTEAGNVLRRSCKLSSPIW